MLTHTPRSHRLDEDVDFIHNYYERRVLQEIIDTVARAQQDREFLADVACVALNRLPPRYIRHDVDMTFFMSPQEMQEIENKVTAAVKAAVAYVEGREHGEAHEKGEHNEVITSAVGKPKADSNKKSEKKTATKKSSKAK